MTKTISPLTGRPAWKALAAHNKEIKGLHLRELFAADAKRGQRLTAEAAGLFLDYSKNRVTDETLKLLFELAKESGLRGRIDAMFAGEKINITEDRAVLHVALRRRRMRRFSLRVRMSFRKSTPCWRKCQSLLTAFAAVTGRDIPVNASATSSISALAARTWDP